MAASQPPKREATALPSTPIPVKNPTTFYSNRPDNLVVIMDMGDGGYQALYGGATEESYAALMEVMEGLGEPM